MVAKEALPQSKSPPIAAFPFVFTEKDYDAPSSVIYNLYGRTPLLAYKKQK